MDRSSRFSILEKVLRQSLELMVDSSAFFDESMSWVLIEMRWSSKLSIGCCCCMVS
jgi:hypothetical protein